MRGIAPTEAAKILNVHPQTVRRWLKERRLRGWMVGGRYRVDPDSIRKMIKPLGSEVEIEQAIRAVEETYGLIQADPDLVKEIALLEDPLYAEDTE